MNVRVIHQTTVSKSASTSQDLFSVTVVLDTHMMLTDAAAMVRFLHRGPTSLPSRDRKRQYPRNVVERGPGHFNCKRLQFDY